MALHLVFHSIVMSVKGDPTRDVDHSDSNRDMGSDYTGPHDLSRLFIVFAVAALVQKEPSDGLGEHFHQIAKAAIGMQPVLEL
jgi:hypothetical protein